MIVEKGNTCSFFYATPQLVIEPGTFKGNERELAALIERQVETYPETFDMGGFIDGGGDSVYSGHPYFEQEKAELEKKDPTACGTTLCIAGYAQLFVDGEITGSVVRRGAELLGLYDGTQLFYTNNDTGKRLLSHLVDGTYDESMAYQWDEDEDED